MPDTKVEFNNIRHILSCVRRAVETYDMIEDGDKIAVGVSGGKDSLTLLCALLNLQRFYPKKFELCAISVSPGYKDMDFGGVREFCERCGVEFRLVETELARLIFEVRREKNPCSLCARMRRGIIHDTAKEMGCNKIALGHHFDDAVETFMMNLFNEGRIGSFLPVTHLSRKNITLIRPMIYAKEKDVRYFVSKNDLPIVKNPCPADGHTQREEMKKLLASLEKGNKGLCHRIFGAMEKGGVFLMTDEEHGESAE